MEKKKKLILIAIGIVVLGIIVSQIDIGEHPVHGNNCVLHACTTTKNEDTLPKKAILFIENSASMKGYVTTNGMRMENINFPKVVKHVISCLSTGDTKTEWQCGTKKGSSYDDLTNKGIEDGSIFTNGTTPLAKYVDTIGAQADDTTVTMFVSDLVLSMSWNEMKGDTNAIENNVVMSSNLEGVCRTLKKSKNIDIMVLQYQSDFNGSYYYNCANNHNKGGCQFKNQIMKNRPYYIMVFGTASTLKSMLANNIFTDYNNIYTTFGVTEQDYKDIKVTPSAPVNTWQTNDPNAENSNNVYTLWVENGSDFEKEKLSATFSFSALEDTMPAFVNPKWEAQSKSKAISKITSNQNSITIEFIPFDKLEKEEQIDIVFVSKQNWVNTCSIDNDKLPLGKMDSLEGKTWGFNKVISAIKLGYDDDKRDSDIVATMTFKAMKY